MYAVIESGGKQYKVGVGDRVKVEKLVAAEGDPVSFDRVLMVSDGEKVTVGAPVVETEVTATVLGHGKGGKIKVFKMKRRKNYRRTQGHRQDFTEIEITAIGGAVKQAKAETDKAAKKDKEKPAAKKAKKKAATKKAAAESGDAAAGTKKATKKKAKTEAKKDQES